MRKKPLKEKQMDYVEEAAEWSGKMTRMRSRGPGDLENAMRSVERDYGIDYWLLWRLRYRRGGDTRHWRYGVHAPEKRIPKRMR